MRCVQQIVIHFFNSCVKVIFQHMQGFLVDETSNSTASDLILIEMGFT